MLRIRPRSHPTSNSPLDLRNIGARGAVVSSEIAQTGNISNEFIDNNVIFSFNRQIGPIFHNRYLMMRELNNSRIHFYLRTNFRRERSFMFVGMGGVREVLSFFI